MLDFFTKLDSNVLRGLLVAVASLIGLIVNTVFNISEEAWGEKAEKIIDAVIQIIALGGAIWAGYARINQPNPNLSVKANEAEAKLVAEGKLPEHLATKGVVDAMPGGQGGYARVGALVAAALLALVACSGLQGAVREADDMPDYAFVLGNVYEGYLDMAIKYKDSPGARSEVVEKMKAVDLKLGPAVEALGKASQAYRSVESAAGEAELQKAVDDVIRLLAEYQRLLSGAGLQASTGVEYQEAA